MEQFSFFVDRPGRWIISVDNDFYLMTCSECSSRVFLKEYAAAVGDEGFRFCPYCGASMKNIKVVRKWPRRYINGIDC